VTPLTLKCLSSTLGQFAQSARAQSVMALSAVLVATAVAPQEASAQSYGYTNQPVTNHSYNSPSGYPGQGSIHQEDKSTPILGPLLGALATSRLGGQSVEGKTAAAVLGAVVGGAIQKGVREDSRVRAAQEASSNPSVGLFPGSANPASGSRLMAPEIQNRYTAMFIGVAAWRTVMARHAESLNAAELDMVSNPGDQSASVRFNQLNQAMGEIQRGLQQSYTNASSAAMVAARQGYEVGNYVQALRGVSESTYSGSSSRAFPGSGWPAVEAQANQIESTLQSKVSMAYPEIAAQANAMPRAQSYRSPRQ
jgi:hypothetical protein